MADSDRIPTNLRTLLILEVLGKQGHAMSATEINDQIGLPKQTVHRLCTTLEEEGFLTRAGNSKKYLPSRRLRDFGAGLMFSAHTHIARHQVLLDVASQVRETVNFVVPEETGMSYRDRVETDWPFRVQLPIGSNVPFHCTASGKTYMASLPPKARRAFVQAIALPELTHRTHTDADSLLTDLNQIAKQGYALDDEEFVDGMIAIAVPVLDSRGNFAAALAFHGPVQRFSIEQAIARKDILTKGAQRLTAALYS